MRHHKDVQDIVEYMKREHTKEARELCFFQRIYFKGLAEAQICKCIECLSRDEDYYHIKYQDATEYLDLLQGLKRG